MEGMPAGEPGGGPEPTTSQASDPARWLRRRLRGGVFRLISRGLPSHEPRPLPDLAELERVLLVLVSERLGHTLLVTPGLGSLLERLRGARVVFVGGPHAPAVLEGYGFDRIEVVSRSHLFRPWRFLGLMHRLRAQRFDAAIHLGTSSRSIGPLLVALSGATHRVGRERGPAGPFFTAPVARSAARHKVDIALDYLASLGASAAGERRMLLRQDEIDDAQALLEARIGDDGVRPIGLFVSGRARKGKDWTLSNFAAVASGVRSRGIPLVVVLGPEEMRLGREIRRAIGEAVYIERESVRRVASIVACCGAVLSLDSGTLHLSIAAGTPTAAVFRKSNFDRWGPRPPLGEVIYDPEGAGAERALETLLRLYDAPPKRLSSVEGAAPGPGSGGGDGSGAS